MRGRVGGAAVAIAVAASSCQDGSALGVSNQCGVDLLVGEAGVADISDDPRLVTIGPEQVEYVVTVDEDWEQAVLLVATSDRPGVVSRVTVRRADATSGDDQDLVVAVAGESCPGAL